MITLEQLKALLASNEDEHLEFKEAKTSYSFDKLVRYCAALSNEGGGHIILGVTDKRPRRVVGTNAFSQPERARAEVVFEYRSSDASGPAQQRKEFRQGFFSFYDQLWDLINLRNDLQHFQTGLFIEDIPTFSERPVREAVLNAVSHRDYQHPGNIFVRQYTRRLVIESPGGFPPGITEQNILDRQIPRNRRVADIFAKCGLVERSGQGMNLMFELSIQEGKSIPDFTGTDAYQVTLTLNGEVQDVRFLQFLEKVGREKLELFGTEDFLLLDIVYKNQNVPGYLKPRLQQLVAVIDCGRALSWKRKSCQWGKGGRRIMRCYLSLFVRCLCRM